MPLEGVVGPNDRIVFDNDGTPFVVLGDVLDMNDDAQGCKRFLLEVLRRAIYDWACFKGRRGKAGEVWREANTWLFIEGPGHPWWEQRAREGLEHLSFLSICERLDKDPALMREAAAGFDMETVINTGRPPLHRYPDQELGDDHTYEEHLSMPLLLGEAGRRIVHLVPRCSEWSFVGPYVVITRDADHRVEGYVDRSEEPPRVARVREEAMEELGDSAQFLLTPKCRAWSEPGFRLLVARNNGRLSELAQPAEPSIEGS